MSYNEKTSNVQNLDKFGMYKHLKGHFEQPATHPMNTGNIYYVIVKLKDLDLSSPEALWVSGVSASQKTNDEAKRMGGRPDKFFTTISKPHVLHDVVKELNSSYKHGEEIAVIAFQASNEKTPNPMNSTQHGRKGYFEDALFLAKPNICAIYLPGDNGQYPKSVQAKTIGDNKKGFGIEISTPPKEFYAAVEEKRSLFENKVR